jgi:hypothetical protein
MAIGCETRDTVGEGELALEVSGGIALEQGFPHTEGDVSYEFVDGWEIQFSTFVVVLANVQLVDQESSSVVANWAGPAILDLRQEGGKSQPLTALGEVPAERLDLELDVVPATAKAENRNADPDAVDRMIEEGWSYLIEGEASRDGETASFSLGLSVHEHYFDCNNGKDRTRGIVIENAKTTGAFIYVHAVHLFWDTLSTGDEDLRFDAFAAVAGDDGIVTMDELATQSLYDLRDANGERLLTATGDPVRYNDDGKLSDDPTLAAFANEAARAFIHFNGVGFCNSEPIR